MHLLLLLLDILTVPALALTCMTADQHASAAIILLTMIRHHPFASSATSRTPSLLPTKSL
jgi:hypothetical protein